MSHDKDQPQTDADDELLSDPEIIEQIPSVDKSHLEHILLLHQTAWGNFQERRGSEWKISISFWTLFTIAIGSLTVSEQVHLAWPQAMALIVGIALLSGIYVYWIHHLAEINDKDRRIALYYAAVVKKSIVLEQKHPDKNMAVNFTTMLPGLSPSFWHRKEGHVYGLRDTFKNWNHRFEMAVTLILAALAIVSIVARS